ncbi:MAG: glycosyltransferase A (GT-A) superfamily protein (DUF2064 family) [Marivirga sp.]|jgi:glycosyltransferase A (GT-A) superfamily protein (DUF2064 family)
MVFSLSPKIEAARKRIVKGNLRKSNELIFQQLISDTKALAKSIKIDLIWVDENNQAGESFGEKFTNALQATFDLGYENIISIGNDSPDLATHHIETAISKLQAGQAVIGPSIDGGIYLVGLHKSQFQPQTFSKLGWEKDYLQQSLQLYLLQHDRIYFSLEALSDIDNASALLAFTDFKPFSILTQLYLNIIFQLQSITKPFSNTITKIFFYSTHNLRGPPSMA